MSDDIFDERRQVLEELFFKNRDQALKAKYQQTKQLADRKDQLAQASGIRNEEVLQHLIEVGIDAETLAALTLVPLIEVAWADQAIERRERKAVLDAAAKAGIETGTPSHDLLEEWLEHRPGHELLDAWKEYVQRLVANMGPTRAEALKAEVLGKSREIAEAAGGMLGIGRVNREEEDMLDELASLFDQSN